MNLRELLEQRAERGTHVGSTTMVNLIESELNHRRFFSFANPVLGFATAAVVTLVLVGGILWTTRPDSEPIPPTDTSTTTTVVPNLTTTTVQDTTEGNELSDWLGHYTWTEYVEGINAPEDQDLTINDVMVHDLYLEKADGSVLTGYVTQNGAQTDRYVAVTAEPAGEYLAIVASQDVGPYTTNTPLFRLSGDPTQPLTTLGQLVTLRLDHTSEGSYFAPPPPDPGEAALANRQFVWNYDPATGNPEELRTALESYDGYSYDLIRLIDEGDTATREVVFEYLKQPRAWNVQTLALMQQYGTPGETPEESEPWPGDVKWAIFAALQEASQAAFGEQAELVVDLQMEVARQELDSCVEEPGGCHFGVSWYAVPQMVSAADGQGSGISFTGSMNIVSDTGAGDSYNIRALRTDEGWVLQEGYRTKTPFVAFMGTDSIVTTTADLQLTGYADPLATLSIDSRPVTNDLQGGYWIANAWDSAPEPGVYEITITATLDGETNTDTVAVTYAPDATRQFAFIRGIDTSGTTPALIVDYAEMLWGEEAAQAAIEDGELENADEGLPNDYYIRNQNPQLRTLPLADNAPIYVMDYTTTGELDFDPLSLDVLVQIMENGDETPYYGGITDSPTWLVVKDDVILSMEPQYLP